MPLESETVVVAPDPAERPEPICARIVEPSAAAFAASMTGELYRAVAFTSFEGEIDPQRFYEPVYDELLARLVGHVLRFEAPIAESLLVQRIARAHGFQRAGRIIRDRVMEIAKRQHFVEREDGGCCFVWVASEDCALWSKARAPASVDDVRQIEDIALVEIRAAKVGRDAVGVARLFGVRRLSSAARERIEAA